MMPTRTSRTKSRLLIVVVLVSLAGCGAGPAPSFTRPYLDAKLAPAALTLSPEDEAAVTVLVATFDRRRDLRVQFGDKERLDLRSLLQWAVDTVDDDARRLGPYRDRYSAMIHAMDTAALAARSQGQNPPGATRA